MADTNQFQLLRSASLPAVFLTQALGAFSDSVFKERAGDPGRVPHGAAEQQDAIFYTNLAAALSSCRSLCSRQPAANCRTNTTRRGWRGWSSSLEIAIMVVACAGFVTRNVAAAIAVLFLMGLHSTLFGPLEVRIPAASARRARSWSAATA